MRPAERKLRVFISSVIDGLECERKRAAAVLEAEGFDPWVFEDKPASSEDLDEGYLRHVADSEYVLWLVGESTTEPVVEEVRLALKTESCALIVVELECAARDEATQELLAEVRRTVRTASASDLESLEEAVRESFRDELRRAVHRERRVRRPITRPPPALGLFVGRGLELDEISAAFARDPGPVTVGINGMGGVGKSALAIRAARAMRGEFDETLYVDLRGPNNEPVPASGVLTRFVSILGGGPSELPTELDELGALLGEQLKRRRCLILLDNAIDPEPVRTVLAVLDEDTRVLVTSRQPLAGLELSLRIGLDSLNETDSARLLTEMVGEDRQAEDPEALKRIATATGHLPLALRIAGARIASRPELSLGELADELEEESSRLEVLDAEDVSIRSSFNLSYRGQPEDRQRLFEAATVFRGADFSAEAAAVLRGEDVLETRRILEELVNGGLLLATGMSSYRFHDLMRDFAREQFATRSTEDQHRALVHLGEWYVAVAEPFRLALDGRPVADAEAPSFEEALAWFEREEGNIAGVIVQLAAAEHKIDLAEELVLELGRYYAVRHRWGDLRDILGAVLGQPELRGDLEQASKFQNNLGIALTHLDELTQARTELELAIELAEGCDSSVQKARALASLAGLEKREGRPDVGSEHLAEAVRLYRVAGDKRGEAKALGDLANHFDDLGRAHEAIPLHYEAIKLFAALGDDYSVAKEQGNLAIAHANLREFPEAATEQRRALDYFARIGAKHEEATARRHLGFVLVALDSSDEGFKELSTAVSIAHDLDDGLTKALVQAQLGQAHALREEFDEAALARERSAELYREMGDTAGYTRELAATATMELAGGSEAEAAARGEQVLELTEDRPMDVARARASYVLATVAARSGEFSRASELLEQAEEILRAQRRDRELVGILEAHFRALDELGHDEAARSKLIELDALRQRLGM